ncbi:MAG: hypothetical protein ABI763_16380 [Bacteroidota bacterium]
MKRTLTLAMLPVFLFSILGWQWLFFLKLNAIEKEEWHGGFEKDNLEIVVVSSENSGETFFINEHELIHEGKLFDVKYKEFKGSLIVCHCQRDNDEETILSSLDVHTNNCFDNKCSSSPKSNTITKLSVFESAKLLLEVKPDCGVHMILESVCYNFFAAGTTDSFFVPPDVV